MNIHRSYDELFSLLNIFSAWRKFRSGKGKKYDTVSFEYHLEDNLFSLYHDLNSGKYQHSTYTHFRVFDNKKRDIHKAEVRDRVVHQIVFDYLESLFDPLFISDTYSSRRNKGAHKAVKTFRYFSKLVVSARDRRCFVLKCDIRKYFDRVDRTVLLDLIGEKIKDQKILELVRVIIYSFAEDAKTGMPLGNITSQIFANIYLSPLDQFVKRGLKARFYIRYNDDFVILDHSLTRLRQYLSLIRNFLAAHLHLEVPEGKASIRKLNWGIDFLGYTILNDGVLLRKKTKAKIFSRISEENFNSYFGLLKHCNSHTLTQKVISRFNNQWIHDILDP